ncbi:type 1 glutamine amidotransferase [Nitrosopumilus sp.]|uniref:type 1 glutamine amidotransferase n=1 Tax=Nitrosopumilus sp. TaxID=2024843 RepID=UPI002612CCF6|nr:gamma-glutamyl-gamma-aminobutyrate hydrolase family protein [Nitrosopumilus sp.]
MLLVVDNGSVFTKNLINFLDKNQISFEKMSPTTINLNSLSEFDSFILSGRRKNEKKTNEINSKIIMHALENNSKLLGICYGAEILALTLGGTIKKCNSLQKGEETVSIFKENSISNNSLDVFESHSYEISKLPNSLLPLGKSSNCQYEVIQHQNGLIFGTQFHPEMSTDGQELIQKFCSL